VLEADCAECVGLCCVAPAFSKSSDFAIDKEAGKACPNLGSDFGCTIHERLAGAGLDVTDPEPLPKGHPLWKFPNVIITPHISGGSDNLEARLYYLVKENIRRFGAGMPLLNVVDKKAGF